MQHHQSMHEPLRAAAVMWGFDKNDPILVRVVEALQKLKRKELSSEEADAELDPLIEAWKKKVRESGPHLMRSGGNSLNGTRLREMAEKAGIDENDALLVRALKAEERAEAGKNWMWFIEMNIACWAFMQGHFEFRKSQWPPQWGRIDLLLHKFSMGRAKPTETEEFRRLAEEVVRGWQPQYPLVAKQRIEFALKWLDSNPAPGEEMTDPSSQSSREPQKRTAMFPPRVPPSKGWLDGVHYHYGIDQSNPVVARVLEILQKAEAGEIGRGEIIKFHVLNDGVNEAYGRKKWQGTRMVDRKKFLAEAKESLSDAAYRRVARMSELCQKIGAGTNSREELEEQCRLYAEMDEKGLEPR
jgi:hypothetical protein